MTTFDGKEIHLPEETLRNFIGANVGDLFDGLEDFETPDDVTECPDCDGPCVCFDRGDCGGGL